MAQGVGWIGDLSKQLILTLHFGYAPIMQLLVFQNLECSISVHGCFLLVHVLCKIAYFSQTYFTVYN